MVKALFDTNILIDYLRGIPAAREELDRYETRAISVITWMEVLTGAPPAHAATSPACRSGSRQARCGRGHYRGVAAGP